MGVVVKLSAFVDADDLIPLIGRFRMQLVRRRDWAAPHPRRHGSGAASDGMH